MGIRDRLDKKIKKEEKKLRCETSKTASDKHHKNSFAVMNSKIRNKEKFLNSYSVNLFSS